MRPPRRRPWGVAGRAAAVGLAVVAGTGLFGWLPERAAERVYAGAVYPVVANVLVPLFGSTPVPGGLLLGLALAAAGLMATIAGLRRRPWRALRRLGAGTLVVLASFYLLWGLAYQRPSVASLLGLHAPPASSPAGGAFADALVAVLARTADGPHDSAAGLASGRDALAELLDEATGVRPTLPAAIAWVPPGSLVTFGSSGFLWPWTLEAHVDPALPGPFYLATALHEFAHVAGIAAEADAELLGLLAGLRSDDPSARYAAALAASARWARTLPETERGVFLARLPAPARDDLEALRRLVAERRRPGLARPLAAIYDRYLRSQGVAAGVADYDRASALLGAALAAGWWSVE